MSNLTVDFYLARVSGGDSFQQALNTLLQIPDNETRNLEFRDAAIRLRQLSVSHQDWSGDMMRIRLNEAAVLASLNGHVEPISVDETRGLGENTAFHYDHTLNVIAVQRNRSAVSASKIAAYIEDKGGLQNALIFEPLFRAETLAKLGDMRNVKKFHLKISPPANLASVHEEVPTLAAAANLAREFQSPTIEIVLSVGRRKTNLHKQSVVAAVRKLINHHDEDPHSVQKIEVSGRYDEDGVTDPLDLIEERLHLGVPIEVSPMPDEFYRRRLSAVRQAFDEKRQEIESLVGNE